MKRLLVFLVALLPAPAICRVLDFMLNKEIVV
jgi:hypothetical protein